MFYTFYKYIKNKGLISTFLKIFSYLKSNGLKKSINRLVQINNYNKFDNPIIACSANSTNSLPNRMLIIYKDNIDFKDKESVLDSFQECNITFLNLNDEYTIFKIIQYSKFLVLYNFDFDNLSDLIKNEISRLCVDVLDYDIFFKRFKNKEKLVQKKNILIVNCYYYPLSFGGATIVVEELNKNFYNNSLYDFSTFTINMSSNKNLYGKVIRYEAFNQKVFAYYVDKMKHNSNLNNDLMFIKAFENVVSNLKPDLIHFHSIQGMGEEMINLCNTNKIKTIVTCHDFWWLTEKQFLTTLDFNKHSIDTNITNYLINEKSSVLSSRKSALQKVNLILVPSNFLKDILINLNFKKIKLNKNGIKISNKNFSLNRVDKECVVFGFIGGNSEIKGFNLIIDAFKKIKSKKIKLLVVDNTTALGYASISSNDLKGIPNYEIIPSFQQNQIDSFYSSIDVLLYPSLAIESFGLAPREAAYRNKIVIATNIGGITEDLIENSNYLPLTPKFTLEELCSKINESVTFIESGENANSKSNIFQDFKKQANELENIYSILMKE